MPYIEYLSCADARISNLYCTNVRRICVTYSTEKLDT